MLKNGLIKTFVILSHESQCTTEKRIVIDRRHISSNFYNSFFVEETTKQIANWPPKCNQDDCGQQIVPKN